MTDVVDKATRSRMMSGIRGKDTKPELLIRSALHRRGFRYRLHVNELPGRPDIVLPKYKALVYVHGCFWHGHSCPYFRLPETRKEFWKTKISGNAKRDRQNIFTAHKQGWRILVIWECATRKNLQLPFESLVDLVSQWLLDGGNSNQIDPQGLHTLDHVHR